MLLEVFLIIASLCLLYVLQIGRPHGGTRPVRVKPPIRQVLDDKAAADVYDCKDLVNMKTTGLMLKVLVRLIFARLGRTFLLPFLKRMSGLDVFTYLYLPEKPTLFPVPCPLDRRDHGDSNRTLLESLVDRAEKRVPFNTVADYVRAYRNGTATPTDVAERVLRCIAESNSATPPLRGIVDWDESAVLEMARASTERWTKGRPLSFLDGVPVAVKGEFRLDPYPFRGGASFVPQCSQGIREAGSVQRLRSAGAILIGVANMQEFGAGTLGSNPNSLHRCPRNPYNIAHFAGGSSSGSAVCVAAGLCPVALGADGGGSIRIPASLCGIAGLKPTNGPDAGSLPLSFSVVAHGPLGASVLDCAIAMDVISTEEEGKKMVPLEGLGEGTLVGLTVGVYWKFFEHADPEIVSGCKAAVSQLVSLGAEVKEVTIPELEETRVAHFLTITSEMAASSMVDVDQRFGELNLETLIPFAFGQSCSSVEYVNAQKQRTRAVEILKHLFQHVDVIVAPATAIPAPPIPSGATSNGVSDATASGQLMRFSYLANFTGIPGLVLPVGYTRSGLPIGFQMMGRWHEEHVLLKAGWALENSGAFPCRKPTVSYNPLVK